MSTSVVTTTTERIRLMAVEANVDETDNNTLLAGGYYAIVHDKTDQLMMYNPSIYSASKNHPAAAGSMTVGTGDDVDAGTNEAFYYINSSGVSIDSRLFMMHQYRAEALWEFSFTKVDGTSVDYNASSPRFGGVAEEYYYRSVWS